MNRPPNRILDIVRSEQITPHMRRIYLGGPNVTDFPTGKESANCKLMFPRAGQTMADVLNFSPFDKPARTEKPIVRTYTIRQFNKTAAEVAIDFVLHENPGPASSWALSCKPGDQICLVGPGPDKLVDFSADWFLFAGDMTALPAICANLEQLPANAKGYAVLEVLSDEDIHQIYAPAEIEVIWIINPKPSPEQSPLTEQVKRLVWLDGSPAAWVAGEALSAKQIRRYLKKERGVEPDRLYASAYWQMGLNEDQHQQKKRSESN
ncbi:siderophore-interacting protein [Corallincola luteus]|uniref:Siderophore-interacting protein n=1 Tax=Corallincola luteus TaxID=1775177 RepID=A0ABY2ALD3_9GAMM|nr:siderophore-interacting protein [Corallincola luteus]TCI03704.1 siderophore-interacting protein [Corallincola luteus]